MTRRVSSGGRRWLAYVAVSLMFGGMEASFGRSLPRRTAESEAASRVWLRVFHGRPVTSLADSRALVGMHLLSIPRRSGMSARDMALADVVMEQFGSDAVCSPVPEELLAARAAELKGAGLTPGERGAVRRLAWRQAALFRLRHPGARRFSFLLSGDAAHLSGTFGGAGTVGEALRRLARQHGLACDYRRVPGLPAPTLRRLLWASQPVVLEERATGRFLLAFGMWREGGRDFVFLNDPANTPVVIVERGQSHVDAVSICFFVIDGHVSDCELFDREGGLTGDIRADSELVLPRRGFLAREYRPEAYVAHVMEGWRRSAEAWDGRLRDIVSGGGWRSWLPLRSREPEPVPPPGADAADGELWDWHFRRGRPAAQPCGAGLAPLELPRADGASPLRACLLALVSLHDPDPWLYTLTPGRMWAEVRDTPGNGRLRPGEGELAALMALGEEREAEFARRFTEFTGGRYHMLSSEVYEDDRVSPHDASRTSEWVLSLLGECGSPEGGLASYAAVSGKRAALEGGRPCPWEMHVRSVLSGMPALVRGAGGGWRLAVGFVEHGGRRLLVTADPTAGWAEGERTRRVARGEPLPRGVRLEEFREGELVSVFVHPFRPDVASVADRVREIFRGNADARPLRLPGEQGESTKDTK